MAEGGQGDREYATDYLYYKQKFLGMNDLNLNAIAS